jgi:predicted phage terminase large subunit-like protein
VDYFQESYPDANSFWDEIQEVKFVKHGDFYDLHVPGWNHYSAEGLWHHNSGKSWIGSLDLIARAEAGRLYLVLSPTYQMLSDSTFRSFEEIARDIGIVQHCRKGTPPMMKLTTGVEILFRSADDPDRLRGPNLSGIWMDEASLMPHDAYTISIGRLREKRKQGWISATFTPKGKSHWTYEVFGMKRPGVEVFHCPTDANPFLPKDFAENTRRQYTSFLASQELGGLFMDAPGLMFRREWFRRTQPNQPDKSLPRVRAWDKAASQDQGDFSAGVLMAYENGSGTFYVCDVVRGQWSADERNRIMLETAHRDGGEVEVFVEAEPGSGGKESAEFTVKQMAGFNVVAEKSTGSKEVRAQPFAAQCEHGNVVVIESHWTADWLDEVLSFPQGKHDDGLDAACMAFNRLALKDHAWEFRGSEPKESLLSKLPKDVGVLSFPENGWEGVQF